ncbi:MAG: anthranilate phosphoribosyltransferase [Candidatus Eremiobacteraeota bacterium]|nr:anthranilate phosphoribosyltransferase [Candidatus Eremiobacteraeota bacterium]
MLNKLTRKENLTADEAAHLMEKMMRNEYSPVMAGALLTALRIKGETVDEITAFARVMHTFCHRVNFPTKEPLLDTCGTGGDGVGTYNISTTVALIAASAGIRVAKHGNRAASSKSGSADVLEALGFSLSLPAEKLVECLLKTGFCFLFAREHHQAMLAIAPVRKDLGIRTVFNLLGPLTNPAGATHQVVGLFSPDHLETVAHVLERLGTRRALVVHGDGTDEFTVTGPSRYIEVRDGRITAKILYPEECDLTRARHESLLGGDAAENAGIIRDVLTPRKVKKDPKRDMALLNAGAALYVAGHSPSIKEGVNAARNLIEKGKALQKLEEIKAFTIQASLSRGEEGVRKP